RHAPLPHRTPTPKANGAMADEHSITPDERAMLGEDVETTAEIAGNGAAAPGDGAAPAEGKDLAAAAAAATVAAAEEDDDFEKAKQEIDGMEDPDDEEEKLEGLQQIISDSTAHATAARRRPARRQSLPMSLQCTSDRWITTPPRMSFRAISRHAEQSTGSPSCATSFREGPRGTRTSSSPTRTGRRTPSLWTTPPSRAATSRSRRREQTCRGSACGVGADGGAGAAPAPAPTTRSRRTHLTVGGAGGGGATGGGGTGEGGTGVDTEGVTKEGTTP
ncbi:unnamed protein product, partial [Ectocarpus fasciculatus]